MSSLQSKPELGKTQPPSSGNVISLDRRNRRLNATSWDQLTARLVLQRHREGRLEESLLAYLLAGCGLTP